MANDAVCRIYEEDVQVQERSSRKLFGLGCVVDSEVALHRFSDAVKKKKIAYVLLVSTQVLTKEHLNVARRKCPNYFVKAVFPAEDGSGKEFVVDINELYGSLEDHVKQSSGILSIAITKRFRRIRSKLHTLPPDVNADSFLKSGVVKCLVVGKARSPTFQVYDFVPDEGSSATGDNKFALKGDSSFVAVESDLPPDQIGFGSILWTTEHQFLGFAYFSTDQKSGIFPLVVGATSEEAFKPAPISYAASSSKYAEEGEEGAKDGNLVSEGITLEQVTTIRTRSGESVGGACADNKHPTAQLTASNKEQANLLLEKQLGSSDQTVTVKALVHRYTGESNGLPAFVSSMVAPVDSTSAQLMGDPETLAAAKGTSEQVVGAESAENEAGIETEVIDPDSAGAAAPAAETVESEDSDQLGSSSHAPDEVSEEDTNSESGSGCGRRIESEGSCFDSEGAGLNPTEPVTPTDLPRQPESAQFPTKTSLLSYDSGIGSAQCSSAPRGLQSGSGEDGTIQHQSPKSRPKFGKMHSVPPVSQSKMAARDTTMKAKSMSVPADSPGSVQTKTFAIETFTTDSVLDCNKLLNGLSRCLDVEYKYGDIKCWKDLAEALGIPSSIYEKFKYSPVASPTQELFEYMYSRQPNMLIGLLKEHLQSMARSDVFDKMQEHIEDGVITDLSPISCLPDTNPDIVGEISPLLDIKRRGAKSWEDLADKFGLKNSDYMHFGSPDRGNPMMHVIDYVCSAMPHVTVGDFKYNIRCLGRMDVLEALDSSSKVKDEWKLKRLTRDWDVLQKVCHLLNQPVKFPKKNWRHVGEYLKVPEDTLAICEPHDPEMTQGPTEALFQYLRTSQPNLKLKTLLVHLHNMNHMDAVECLMRHIDTDRTVSQLVGGCNFPNHPLCQSRFTTEDG